MVHKTDANKKVDKFDRIATEVRKWRKDSGDNYDDEMLVDNVVEIVEGE